MVSPGFFVVFSPKTRRKNIFWKFIKSAKKLLIFSKKSCIIGVSGEKCHKVERSGDFPQLPPSFPQPGGETKIPP